MKRLINIPDEIDKELVAESERLGFTITHIIKQILWAWKEQKDKQEVTK